MAVQTPVEFMNYARATRPQTGSIVRAMLAGDYCGLDADGSLSVTIVRAFEAEEYRDAAQEFLAARPQKTAQLDGPAVDLAAFIERLNGKLAGCGVPIDNVIRMDLDYRGGKVLIEIDALTYRARLVEAFDDARPYHHFKLDPVASADWLNGKRFEEVIGMRRFTVKRVPDLYLPDLLRLVNTVI